MAVVLAVICLPVMSDAQPTIDESMTCSLSTLEELMNMAKIVASNQRENAKDVQQIKEEIKDKVEDEIKGVKTLIVSGSVQTNESRIEQIIQEIKNEIREETRDVKNMISSGCEKTNDTRLEEVAREIREQTEVVKQLLVPRPIELNAGEPSKQALVSALVCEYLVCL